MKKGMIDARNLFMDDFGLFLEIRDRYTHIED